MAILSCFANLSLAQSAYVNPFVGTDAHGHTFPGATTPFGMVQLSPDTRVDGSWDGCSGYHYSDSKLYGFSHTHLSGTGCTDYGDVLLQPFLWQREGDIPKNFAVEFRHEKEQAAAGYYSVNLENGIFCELTASPRTGFHQYDFGVLSKMNKTATAGIVLDLYHRDELTGFEILTLGEREVYGYRRSKAWAKDQIVYFWITFSEPFVKSYQLDKDNNTARGGAKMAFDFGKKQNIKVKVAISAVDAKGANRNMAKEIPHWDFEQTRREATALWDKELSKIQVEGGTEAQKRTFYSALYHCMIAPNLYSDVDGQYRGRDNQIHHTDGTWDYYTVFSLWDTYRALHPLLSIIDEKRTNDFVRTFIAQHEQGGLLPVWELSANETFCMIGYHSVSVIADAYLKGIRNYDAEKAFQAMKNAAMQDHYGLAAYKKLGYVPSDKEHESVSKTLEYAYDDWCIAQMARELGHTADYDYFMKRAQGYLNLFDPQTAFFRPRKNGGWLKGFRPNEVNNHYTEANAFQYSFGNQHEIQVFNKLLEGKGTLEAKLDTLFQTRLKMAGRDQADITGLIGQYAHGNEPSHHIPYLYNYTPQAWKTQQYVHQIMTDFYTDKTDGLCGNEDCGQMSAWYVLSALGMYQVAPGNPTYVFGTPLFPKVRIQTAENRYFTIEARNHSAENYYVKSVSLNGVSLRQLAHSDFRTERNTLVFEMSPTPLANNEVPKSRVGYHLFEYAPVITASSQTFKDTLTVSIERVKPVAVVPELAGGEYKKQIYFTTDGSEPDTTSTVYRHPFVISQNATIKAKYIQTCTYQNVSFINGESVTSEANFYKVNPEWHVSFMNCKPNAQYYADGPQTLIDGVRGEKNWRLGNWVGFQGQDVEIVLDLGRLRRVDKVTLSCLQDFGSWIAMPKEVVVEAAKDGGDFERIGSIKHNISDRESENVLHDFSLGTNGIYARRLRLTALNYGPLPNWHPGAGGETFIFMDEVRVD